MTIGRLPSDLVAGTASPRSSTDAQGIRLGRGIDFARTAEPEAGREGPSLRGRFGVGGPLAKHVRWKSVEAR